MSLTWYLSWRKREQRKKSWKRDTKRIKTKEGTYPGSKLARASFIPWAISIQLLELTKPPLFTSCLINTLLLSAKVLLTSRSSYISLSLLSKGSSKQGHPFFFVPFPLLLAMARERKFVSFVLGVSFAEASLSLLSLRWKRLCVLFPFLSSCITTVSYIYISSLLLGGSGIDVRLLSSIFELFDSETTMGYIKNCWI